MTSEGPDKVDKQILKILEKDARLSYSEIGEKVGLSRVSVKNRMDAMEKEGIIQGYKAITNMDYLPAGRHFFVEIATEPEVFNKVVDDIASYNIIRGVYAVTGESRFIAEGFASTNMWYESFMKSVRKNLKGVISFRVSDVLYTLKDLDGGVDYVRLEDREDERGN